MYRTMPVTTHTITTKELVQCSVHRNVTEALSAHLWAKAHCMMTLVVVLLPVVQFREMNQSVKGQPHASKNGRNPELSNVKHILLELQNISVNSLALLPSCSGSMPPSLEPGQIFMTMLTNRIQQKRPYTTSKGVMKRQALLPCSPLRGSLHAVRKPKPPNRENTGRCSS